MRGGRGGQVWLIMLLSYFNPLFSRATKTAQQSES